MTDPLPSLRGCPSVAKGDAAIPRGGVAVGIRGRLLRPPTCRWSRNDSKRRRRRNDRPPPVIARMPERSEGRRGNPTGGGGSGNKRQIASPACGGLAMTGKGGGLAMTVKRRRRNDRPPPVIARMPERSEGRRGNPTGGVAVGISGRLLHPPAAVSQ